MPYYVLAHAEGALYSMNMLLSEDEARRYDKEGETVPVQALFVWTSLKALEDFQQFLSVEQRNQHSPFAELIRDMKAGKVDGLGLSAGQVRDHLRKYQRVQFVCLEPGPSRAVIRTEELLAQLENNGRT